MQERNLGLGLKRSPDAVEAHFLVFNFEDNFSLMIPAYK